MKRKIAAVAIVLVMAASGLYLYAHNVPYAVYKANKRIDVAGLKLLMPVEEATAGMQERGKYLAGFGGYSYVFEQSKIIISFSNDAAGITYNKISWIDTANGQHSILGVHVGDTLDKAASILAQSGFKQDGEENYYRRRDIYVYLYTEGSVIAKLRIGVIDPYLKGRIY